MIRISRAAAADAAQLKDAMDRAAASGVAVMIEPPDNNVYLTRAESADHRRWLAAKEQAAKAGGTVVTLDH